MRILFVYTGDTGSDQTIQGYATAAEALGHEIVVHGRASSTGESDAVVFILEGRPVPPGADNLDLARLVAGVPRERRVVIDTDGCYNDAISVGAGDVDRSYGDTGARVRWIEIADSLSDKIVQPTLHPLRENVGTFFFHAYNPDLEIPLDFAEKPYGMAYVGTNWFRWEPLKRVLGAVEPVRAAVGRMMIAGNGWSSQTWWAPWAPPPSAHVTDPDYLRGLDIELCPPVPVGEVVPTMSLGVVNPVLLRPIFDLLHLVTVRTFETLAANTVPLFIQDTGFVAEIYGEQALELCLPEVDAHEKIVDLLERPGHYGRIVERIRARLREHFSHERQLGRLVELIEA